MSASAFVDMFTTDADSENLASADDSANTELETTAEEMQEVALPEPIHPGTQFPVGSVVVRKRWVRRYRR